MTLTEAIIYLFKIETPEMLRFCQSQLQSQQSPSLQYLLNYIIAHPFSFQFEIERFDPQDVIFLTKLLKLKAYL